MEDIGIYINIHYANKKNKTNHKFYYGTCKFCNTTVMKLLGDFKRSPNHCTHFHSSHYTVDRINDMPNRWTSESDYNKRVYSLWRHMLMRTSENYWIKEPTYKGTTVCEEWRKLSVFSKDIKLLKNYQLWKDNPNKRIMLDKDVLGHNSKKYSPTTCCFLTHADSNRDVLSRHPEIIDNLKKYAQYNRDKISIFVKAINKKTKEVRIYKSIKECSKDLHIENRNIWMCLSNKEKYKSHKSAKGWTFDYN